MSAQQINEAPSTPLVSEPDVTDCNWLICDGYGNTDPRAHHRNCPGSKAKAGWRARVGIPFVLDEVDRLMSGNAEDTPTFRGLAVERCIAARYGGEKAAS